MLKNKLKTVILILMFLGILVNCSKVHAINITQVEYTEEYEEWIALPEEEKSRTIPPKMFELDTQYSNNKFMTKIKTLMSSVFESKFDLRDKIMKNLQIRNQEDTMACWTFATLSSLETNLAMKDNSKIYDFSESHMDYSTSQSFTDGEIKNGFKREVSQGGNFQMGAAYLTNGQGAILEEDMPFNNTMQDISISEIQGKNTVTKVTDTEEFATFTNSIDKDELILKIKNHIKNYGSISAGIHGASLDEDCYNNLTGAICCKDISKCTMDHNVSIIGWDDGFSKDNFSEKPVNNGAWIIRNSWGTETNGIEIGDEGFMYVSYEDINIYSQLFGIENATETINYDKIYQYNELAYNNALKLGVNKIYIANVFERDKTKQEELTEVALNVMQKVKCRVYVNPNGESKAVSSLQEIKLVAGDTETFDAGYHTLEFKNPVRLTGDKFAIVIEIEALEDTSVHCPILTKTTNNFWDNVEIKENANYITYGEFFGQNEWIDIVLNSANIGAEKSNLTIKAFTRKTEIIATPTPTQKPTYTPTPTVKPTQTPTVKPTVTPTPTQIPTHTPTATVKPTIEPTPTVAPTASIKPTVTPTQTIKPTETVKPIATVKPTETTKPTNKPTVRPTNQINITKPTATPSSNNQILGTINTNSNSIGNTMANQSSLPHAGKTEVILALIILLSINMIIVYKKYKKIY